MKKSKKTGLPKTQVSHLLASQLSQEPLHIQINPKRRRRKRITLKDVWNIDIEF